MNRKLGCVVEKSGLTKYSLVTIVQTVFARFNKLLKLLLAKYEENLIKTFAQLCM